MEAFLAALARVDELVPAPWVVQLDAGSDVLPDGVSAILAARTDPVAPPAVVTWAPLDPSGTSTDHAMRLDGDAGPVLAAVAALVGLRDAATAPDRLRDRRGRAGLAAGLDVDLRVDLGERPAALVRRADAPVLEVRGAQTGDDLVVRGAGDDVHGVMMPERGSPGGRAPPGERSRGQRARS